MLNNCDTLHKFKHICILCQFYYINFKFRLSLSPKNRKMHCKLFFYFSVQLNMWDGETLAKDVVDCL